MASPLVQFGLVPILAGAVGAAGAAFVMSLGSGSPPEPVSSAEFQIEPLRRDMERLEQENLFLRRRLDDLESMAWHSVLGIEEPRDVPRPLSDDGVFALRRQVEALAAAFEEASRNPDEGPLLDTVASALRVLREREEQERLEAGRERMAQLVEERLAELAPEIGLDAWQRTQMQDLFVGAQDERFGIFEAARRTGDFAAIRDGMQALDASTQARLASILSPGQLQRYDELGGMGASWGGVWARRGGGAFFGGDGGEGGGRWRGEGRGARGARAQGGGAGSGEAPQQGY